MKLSVIVPVYNEKDTVEEIIKRIQDVRDLETEIIVVDDGSTDGTREILKKLEAQHPEIKFMYKYENKGKGHTLKIGFENSTGDYVIVQDADLEYDPQEYKKLIRALEEENVDVVYGSRFSGSYKDMSGAHYFGNKMLTIVTDLLFGVLLTDMETCYKLMPGDFVRKIKLKSDRFDFEPEITAKILKAGLKIREIPINYKGRSHSEGKKITWKDGIGALWALIKFRFLE